MTISISIKNVPDELAALLKEQARRNHRSLQGEILAILEESQRPRLMTVAEAAERIRAIGIKTGDDSTRMVREDRDAR